VKCEQLGNGVYGERPPPWHVSPDTKNIARWLETEAAAAFNSNPLPEKASRFDPLAELASIPSLCLKHLRTQIAAPALAPKP